MSKSVIDSDGFLTDYVWYTNGDKHIFMFGDEDYTEPDEDYADWECDSEKTAQEWFDTYEGFADEFEPEYDADEYDDDWSTIPNDNDVAYNYTIVAKQNGVKVSSEDFEDDEKAKDYFWKMAKKGYEMTIIDNIEGTSTDFGKFNFDNSDKDSNPLGEEVSYDVKESEAWGYDKIFEVMDDLTNHFTMDDGAFKSYFESEKDHIKNILSKQGYNVEVSDGRKSDNEDMCWVVAYSRK